MNLQLSNVSFSRPYDGKGRETGVSSSLLAKETAIPIKILPTHLGPYGLAVFD